MTAELPTWAIGTILLCATAILGSYALAYVVMDKVLSICNYLRKVR